MKARTLVPAVLVIAFLRLPLAVDAQSEREMGVIENYLPKIDIAVPGQVPLPHDLADPIYSGEQIVTAAKAELEARFGRYVAVENRVLQVASNARVHVTETGYQVLAGCATVIGKVTTSGSPNTVVCHTNTAYVTCYDEVTNTTEILGIEGWLEIQNRAGGAKVVVLPRTLSRVVGTSPPETPRFLDDEEYARFVKPFEFIGRGQAQSYALAHPLLSGASIPGVDTAPPWGILPNDGPDNCFRSSWCERPPFPTGLAELGIDF